LLAGQNATLEALEYAHYLIVEKKAKVTDPIIHGWFMKKTYPRIISGGYIKALGLSIGFGRIPNKMEIVEEFADKV